MRILRFAMIVAACLATTATTSTAEEPTYRIQIARPFKAGSVYRVEGQAIASSDFRFYGGGKEVGQDSKKMTLRMVADMTVETVDDVGSILVAKYQIKSLNLTADGETNEVLPVGTVIEQRKGDFTSDLLVGGEKIDESLAVLLLDITWSQEHVTELGRYNPPQPMAIGEGWQASLSPKLAGLFRNTIGMDAAAIAAFEVSGKLERADTAPVNKMHVVMTLGSAEREYKLENGESLRFYGTEGFRLPMEPTSPMITRDSTITMVMKRHDDDGNLAMTATMGQTASVTLSPIPKD